MEQVYLSTPELDKFLMCTPSAGTVLLRRFQSTLSLLCMEALHPHMAQHAHRILKSTSALATTKQIVLVEPSTVVVEGRASASAHMRMPAQGIFP